MRGYVTPGWLRERNEDPFGTPPRHPFWAEVSAEQVGAYRVFERDGVWYAYDTKYNAWWHFASRAAAAEHASGGSVDVWA